MPDMASTMAGARPVARVGTPLFENSGFEKRETSARVGKKGRDERSFPLYGKAETHDD